MLSSIDILGREVSSVFLLLLSDIDGLVGPGCGDVAHIYLDYEGFGGPNGVIKVGLGLPRKFGGNEELFVANLTEQGKRSSANRGSVYPDAKGMLIWKGILNSREGNFHRFWCAESQLTASVADGQPVTACLLPDCLPPNMCLAEHHQGS